MKDNRSLGGGGSRSSLAHYIKGRSRRTRRLELQPVAAARGAATGGGFPPCAVGSGQRPPGPLKGRGHFFFLRAILEFFLAPGGLPLHPSSPSSSRRSPLLRQDPILFERFPPQFCGGLGHPRVFFFFSPFFFVLFSSCFLGVDPPLFPYTTLFRSIILLKFCVLISMVSRQGSPSKSNCWKYKKTLT